VDAVIASRCTDDTGYTQPPLADLIKVRGVNSNYHNNGIHASGKKARRTSSSAGGDR
jgi:hypothetical protein